MQILSTKQVPRTGRDTSRWELKCISTKNLRNHVNVDELTRHDFIPHEAGLRNMVKNGENLPY